jgi:hypothetical protein
MYTGGTPEGIKFIEKYKKSGYVVDFYSDEHIKSLDEDSASISVDDLKDFDLKHGTAYRGHMLAIYLGDQNWELLDDLSNLYLPFQRLFNLEGAYGGTLHKPDLLLVNLVTQEVLCVGLGRKNRSFNFELHRYLQCRTTNDSTNKGLREFDKNASIDCSEKFFELDHHKIAKRTLSATENLGENYFEYDNLPGNADVIVTLNEDDGLFYLDDFEDEEGMTEEEVKELEENYANYREWIDDCIHVLREIFPKIDDWDLNTGDY